MTAISKDGSRTDYVCSALNLKDPMELLNSLWLAQPIRRKREAEQQQPTPTADPIEQAEKARLIAEGKAHEATDEEIEEMLKRRRLEQEKKDETTDEKKDDKKAPQAPEPTPTPTLTPAPPPAQPPAQPTPQPPADPKNGKDTETGKPGEQKPQTQQPEQTQQPSQQPPQSEPVRPVQPVQPQPQQPQQPPAPAKIDTATTDAIVTTSKQERRILEQTQKSIDSFMTVTEKLFGNLAKQSDTLNKALIESIESSKSQVLESNTKQTALIQESIRSLQADTTRIAAESEKLTGLTMDSIKIQKSHAGDSKRIANQANVRSFSLGQAQEQYNKLGFSFDFDPLLQRIVVNLNLKILQTLILSPTLARLCGFSNLDQSFEISSSRTVAAFVADINYNLENMYVYADCIVPRIVGNIHAPLLRVIPVSNDQPYASTVSKIFNPIQYMPISVDTLDTIGIRILDSKGKHINFSFGNTIVILHFIKA